MKTWVRLGAILLAVVLLLGTAAPAFADELDDLYEDLERIREERKELEAQEKAIDKKIENLNKELALLDKMLGQSQEKLRKLNQQIRDQEALIAQQEQYIEEKELQIQETEEYLEEQLVHLENRTRALYKNGSVSYLEVLFDAASFSDFLSRLSFLGTIIESDSQLINEVRDTRDWLEQERIALEEELDLLVERRVKLENDRLAAKAEENRVQSLVDEQRSVRTALRAEQDKLAKMIKEAEDEEERINKEIIELLDDEEFKAGDPPAFYNWPVPVTRYISSPYGWRTLYGQPNWHGGIDIAPSHIYWPGSPRFAGTPAYIQAAATGKVASVAYNAGGYGWYVIIAHGGGHATLYAHMHQRPSVSVGQIVTRGQNIGIVGSTGNSTGPHLHFEIRINGVRQNPMNYGPFR